MHWWLHHLQKARYIYWILPHATTTFVCYQYARHLLYRCTGIEMSCCRIVQLPFGLVIVIHFISGAQRYHIKKSLFWVHIQAQSSALQTLTSTVPGHWAFTLHIHLDIHLNSLGSIQLLTRNLAPRLTNLPSQVPTLLLGREKQCSVKCLAQGHNEQTHRQGVELGTWPGS